MKAATDMRSKRPVLENVNQPRLPPVNFNQAMSGRELLRGTGYGLIVMSIRSSRNQAMESSQHVLGFPRTQSFPICTHPAIRPV